MRLPQMILSALVLIAVAPGDVWANSIEVPAGALPSQEPINQGGGGLPLESSKSRLVPLPVKMKLASRSIATKSKNPKQTKLQESLKVNLRDDIRGDVKVIERKPAPEARVSKRLAMSSAKPPVAETPAVAEAPIQPSAGGRNQDTKRSASKKYESPHTGMDAEIPSSVNTSAEAAPIDPWDSASNRLDKEEPAKASGHGLRVEDIIEPTAAYHYSLARRKNPFVPDLVLAKPQKTKEIGSNDVEIPIISPLQSFKLSELSVIGVWQGDDMVWKALIQTKLNQGIETKLGDPAGNSGGRVMAISPDAVLVREFSVRADGAREYRDVQLTMGGEKVLNTENSGGGRLILKPGASDAEIEKGDSAAKISTDIPP